MLPSSVFSACWRTDLELFFDDLRQGFVTTSLISQLQSIGGHGVVPCEAGQRQVHNALLAQRHR